MIRTLQKHPDPSSRHEDNVLRRRGGIFRHVIEPCLRLIEKLQWRAHEKLITHVLEEKLVQLNSRSKSVIAKMVKINGKLLSITGKREDIPIKNKPILVVDDEKNIRLTVSQTLESLGLKTDSASTGEEALAKLREKEFGLILLDLNMPVVDGVEVLRQVRKYRPDLRVIVMTAYGTRELAVEAIKLGAVDVIRKPFVPEEIRKRVGRVIETEKPAEEKGTDYGS